MIVSCPQCAARYRLDVGVVMRRPRLKCADCGNRWVPAEEIDEDEAVAAVQEEVRAARNPPPPPEPEPESPPEPDAPPPEPEDPERTPWGKWLLAIVLGVAFTIASVGLWVGRIDPESLPGVDVLLAQVAAPEPQLDVAVQGRVTRLPGSGAILEVTGQISNPGRSTATVPALNARLLVGGTTTREWAIPPPAASIAPGQRLAFASTITDVPAGSITVQVRFARPRIGGF